MAIATGISPIDLIEAPPEVLLAMIAILEKRAKAEQQAASKRRR